MGRQERRRRMRQRETSVQWDKIIVALVLVFFAGTALMSYMFPVISNKSYAAGGARIQRIIINRAIADLNKKTSLEFMYSYVDEKNNATQYHVKEEGSKITLKHTQDDKTVEYTPTTVPADYKTVSAALSALNEVLANRDFKIVYQESEAPGYNILNVVRYDKDKKPVEGYALYFTPEHTMDILHHYRKVGDETFIQRIYSGLVSGVAPATQP